MRRPEPTTLKPLRARRNPRERDLSITSTVGELAGQVQRQHRQFGGSWETWSAVVPAELAAGSELVRLTRGLLSVRAADSGVRFALDRFLRAGGEHTLIRASGGKIKRVKLV